MIASRATHSRKLFGVFMFGAILAVNTDFFITDIKPLVLVIVRDCGLCDLGTEVLFLIHISDSWLSVRHLGASSSISAQSRTVTYFILNLPLFVKFCVRCVHCCFASV
jgi:hypothetical protein